MSSKSKAKSGREKEPVGTERRREGDDRPPIEQPTPIIITGGSPLTVESQVVEWGDWTDIDTHRKRHPLGSRKITRILIQDDNNPTTPPTVVNAPANGKCSITVVYEL